MESAWTSVQMTIYTLLVFITLVNILHLRTWRKQKLQSKICVQPSTQVNQEQTSSSTSPAKKCNFLRKLKTEN